MPFDLTDLLASTLRFGAPILFAAMGGLLSERAGIVNIGLEGMMLIAAFFAVFGSFLTGSPWIGLVFALVAGVLAALLHAVATIRFEAN